VKHGAWLTWLAEHFDGSTSTATNYMHAAEFAIKFPTVTNLKLRPAALYVLGLMMDEWDQAVIDAILAEAETVCVNEDRVWEIERATRPVQDTDDDDTEETGTEAEEDETGGEDAEEEDENEEDTEAAEAAAILDGAPPSLPPAHEPDELLFDQTIETLMTLRTKPAAKFDGSIARNFTGIVAAKDFLQELIQRVAPVQRNENLKQSVKQ
jgi:hypothetical protein